MNNLFCEGLAEHDTAKLLSVPKSDLHIHSTKGCRRAWLEERIGRSLSAPPERFGGLEGMQAWFTASIKPWCSGREGIVLRWEGAFAEAAMDVYAGAAIGNDKVVMIWYDDTANKLMYMYRENLTATGDNTDASVDGVTGKWSKPKAIFNTRLQDCAIKADPLGGIHITTYDQTNANLLYAYLPTYNHLETTGNTPYTCVIDAYSQVGKNMMIDTVLDSSGTKVIPYISYFTEGMSFLPKLAYIPGGIDKTNDATIKASIKDGSDPITNLFTGNWEVVLLPSDSALQQYKICVGAFRDTNNKTTTPTVTGTTSTSVTNGTVYPNNQTNLVVGYSIRENGVSYMETAMRKGVPDTEQH